MKIAYITERDLNSKQISGAITRDIILLEALKSFANVDIYYNSPVKYHKYRFLLNNKNKNLDLYNKINQKIYDIVIISVFMNSPYLNGYDYIDHKKIFYIADSSFHMNRQKLNFKYKIASHIYKCIESKFIKNHLCAYLGEDEVNCIPKKYHKHCLIFPFFIDKKQNKFNQNGKIILVGNYNFKPNYIMLENINSIADYINKDIYIYGQNIPMLNFKTNIKIVGYVKTIDEIYANSKALVYCVNYGTGIKNKVFEAMSYGIPTIGFKEAFTNLNLIHKESCLQINFLEELREYLNNFDFTEISSNAYQITEKCFSKEKIAFVIKETIDKVIKGDINV